MDNFINIAKQGYEAYNESQKGQQGGQGHNQQGGQAQGQPIPAGYTGTGSQAQGEYGHNQPSAGGYSSQSGPPIDHQAAIQNATQTSGGSGDFSLFDTALGFLNQNQSQHTQPINEQHVQNAHTEAYEKGKASSLDAGSLGAAAAMQASADAYHVLKSFTSGGASTPGAPAGGNSQTQLIALAMSEASKLFETQGSASGQKQDAVNGAAMTVMKLLVQSKMGGAPTTGGGNSGGLGQFMELASKFAK